MTNRMKLGTAATLMVLLLTACGGSGPTATTTGTYSRSSPTATTTVAESGHAAVSIRNYMFTPMHLVVTAGTKVSFHNYDQTNHTATALNQTFDTGTIAPGKTVTVTLKKPGTYAYHCLFHAFMTATIKVTAASTS